MSSKFHLFYDTLWRYLFDPKRFCTGNIFFVRRVYPVALHTTDRSDSPPNPPIGPGWCDQSSGNPDLAILQFCEAWFSFEIWSQSQRISKQTKGKLELLQNKYFCRRKSSKTSSNAQTLSWLAFLRAEELCRNLKTSVQLQLLIKENYFSKPAWLKLDGCLQIPA